MLDFNLIKNVLIIAIGSSIITTALVQKIKESLKDKKWLNLISFVISMIFGTLFALSFTNIELEYALWVGVISYIGADAIYKAFEDKIFKPFNKMNEVVEIPKENEIKEN